MKIHRAVTASCAALVLSAGMMPVQAQQANTPAVATPVESQPGPVVLSAAQLDDLAGPIALYPDPLVAQILPASTFPTDIVLAARLVAKGATPAELDAQGWDPSVRAIAYYPSILKMMDERLAWTASLGAAFLQQPDDLMDSVQRLRSRARALGHLQDTPQQKVIIEEAEPETTVVRIVPASPQVVYVPTYDPVVVYERPWTASVIASPWVGFSLGFAIGSWLDLDCDWYGRRCYYPVGWTWSTCGYSSWYSWPRYYSSYWGGPSWCGPGVYVSWHSGYGHYDGYGHGHGYRYVGHGSHHGYNSGYDHSYNPYGRTTDVARRSAPYASRGVPGRTQDARQWARDVDKSPLPSGARQANSGSDMYKRSARGTNTRLDGTVPSTRMRTADQIKRDLSDRSITSRSRTDSSKAPGMTRGADTLRRDTTDRLRAPTSRPDIAVPRNTTPRSTTSPGGLKRSDTTVRTSPGTRSTGLRAPSDTRVRTVSPSRGTTSAPRSTAPRSSPSVRPSTGSSPRATAPSTGRSGTRSASPSRSSPGPRSSPAPRSSGGSPGNKRSK